MADLKEIHTGKKSQRLSFWGPINFIYSFMIWDVYRSVSNKLSPNET